MKAVLDVDQNAALLAGKNSYGKKEVEFDPADLTEEERDVLAKSRIEDGKYILYARASSYNVPDYKISEANTETLRHVIAFTAEYRKDKAQREADEKRKAIEREDENRKRWIAEALDDWNNKFSQLEHIDYIFRNRKDNLTSDEVAQLEAKRAELKALIEAEEKARAEEKAKEEQERRDQLAAREKQIADWIASKGTASQKERYEAGMLPEDEIFDAMRNEAFAPLDHIKRYDRMGASDVCECDDGFCKVEFEVDDMDEVPDHIWQQMKQIKSLLPGCGVDPRIHTGEASYCDAVVKRIGLRVRMTVGAFTFTREYEANKDAGTVKQEKNVESITVLKPIAKAAMKSEGFVLVGEFERDEEEDYGYYVYWHENTETIMLIHLEDDDIGRIECGEILDFIADRHNKLKEITEAIDPTKE
jgi:hypothetical protein